MIISSGRDKKCYIKKNMFFFNNEAAYTCATVPK